VGPARSVRRLDGNVRTLVHPVQQPGHVGFGHLSRRIPNDGLPSRENGGKMSGWPGIDDCPVVIFHDISVGHFEG
jgi:hypothetical protein